MPYFEYRFGVYILIIGLMLFFIGSCTSKMENVISKESFSAEKLISEKVLFWGLSTGSPVWDKKKFLLLSNIALATLVNKRANIEIHADTILLSRLGHEKYADIYQKNRIGETLNSENLAAISSAAEEYRYIVLSRIDNNKIGVEISGHPDKTNACRSKRNLTIHTDIYDLKDYELAWSGDNSNVRYRTNNIEKHGGKITITDLIHASIEDRIYTTCPPPPAIEQMVKQSFKQLAAGLPNKSCSEVGYLYCAK